MSVYSDAGRLLCARREADEAFWDGHWAGQDMAAELAAASRGTWVSRLTRKHLPRGSRVLEGGAGLGRNVVALSAAGFDAVGVDFAPETVARAKTARPGLQMVVGDVRGLPFPDASFDGYWSVGVIEHFRQGYAPIAAEMRRVLKPGGLLFLSFPHLSALRRLKAASGAYPAWHGREEEFYQYLLDGRDVRADFAASGFRLRRRSGFDGLKGLKDEWPAAQPALQRLYDGRGLASRALRRLLEPALAPWAGHCSLLVLERCP
ncbi:MAG: class I SAM-dependent methyltransferase [Elusimicrobia bacterium]|nr:class I SAM-dependent methyltransferase [Elusimicrobiota bacterium]